MIEYRNFTIEPLIISKIIYGDEEYEGFTHYVITKHNGEPIVYQTSNNLKSVDEAKAEIDRYYKIQGGNYAN